MAVPQTLATPTHPGTGELSEASNRSGAADRLGRRDELLAAGTRVEVRRRLDGEWARGFEIVSASDDGYRVKRLSDGCELPLTFSDDDIRKEKKRGTWWY